MAKYNREFLVPYLENLCALHIAKRKIERKRTEISSMQRSLRQELNSIRIPQEPEYESIGFIVFAIIFGIALIIFSLQDVLILSFLAGLAGWPIAIGYCIKFFKARKSNRELENRYLGAKLRYQDQMKNLRKQDDELTTYAFVQYSFCQAETEKIDAVLKKVYDVNIIPRHYRDIYVAVYLYDWFSTSMSDDLDMALNMYVLEEIKDRLDSIINMLAKSLVNQKLIMDNQQKSMEQQALYRREMLGKLDRMAVTSEEHSRYLGMIEANTAAAAYFSAAEYVRKM